MRKRWLLTALTVLAATLGIGVFLIAATDGSDHTHHHPELNVHNGLLVSTRTDFQVCVQLDPASTVDKVTTERNLRAAIDQVRRHPVWPRAYEHARYDAATAITWGCPGARLPERHDRVTVAGPGVTAHPSPFRVWIYVLDRASADRVLGPQRSVDVATAELMGAERTLFPVSSALLIRDAELARTTATVAEHLGEAAGLPRG